MPVTVKDVAVTASVSLGTVSRVLNGDPSVSADVRQRVRKAVESLGYTRLRNRTRSSGSAQLKTRNIALVLLGMDRGLASLPSVSAAIHGAESALKEVGANLLLVDVPRVDHLPAALVRNRIDGLLLKGALHSGLLEHCNSALTDRLGQLPSVWFLGKPHGAWGDVVQSNDRAVGQIAAGHLISHGHRRLAFLSPKRDQVTFAQRQAGFEWHARRAGADVTTIFGEDCSWLSSSVAVDNVERVDRLVEQLLNSPQRPTAAFVPGDVVAAMVYRALAKRGLQVGRDLSLISCNNESPLLTGLYPSLTTIEIHAEMIGRRAVDQLVWRLNHLEAPSMDVAIEPALREGDSVNTIGAPQQVVAAIG